MTAPSLKHFVPSPCVPFPDEFGVSPEGVGGGKFAGVVLCPQAGLGFAEGGDAAFGGDTYPGQNGDARGVAQGMNEFGWEVHLKHKVAKIYSFRISSRISFLINLKRRARSGRVRTIRCSASPFSKVSPSM